jgi:hypothetical protein
VAAVSAKGASLSLRYPAQPAASRPAAHVGLDCGRTSADREIQRTLMELLNQLDGFDQLGKVKIIMATVRHLLLSLLRLPVIDVVVVGGGGVVVVVAAHLAAGLRCPARLSSGRLTYISGLASAEPARRAGPRAAAPRTARPQDRDPVTKYAGIRLVNHSLRIAGLGCGCGCWAPALVVPPTTERCRGAIDE